MRGRAIFVVVSALLLAALVVRTAVFDAYASKEPLKAAAIWPGHPSLILASGLEEIGRDAAAGRPADKMMVDRLVATAAKDPFAPEPFLVRGVDAQLAGNEVLAGRAFLEARNRQPRGVAARYFLAEHFLRTGEIQRGLTEISSLTQLVPQSLGAIAPYLAAYARSEGAATQVKMLLRHDPRLEPLLLNTLAANASDARLALSLWSGRGGEGARPWQARMINSLIEAGRFDEAHAIWLRFARGPVRREQLIDTKFQSDALPPFGWTLASGTAGFAEPDESGRLRVLYYGRDNLVLASQLMMLKPGRYQLSMQVGGASPAAKSVAWTVRCMPSSNEIANIGIGDVGKGGALARAFTVPATGCAAQTIALTGSSPEFPEQAEFTIAGLQLEREVAR